MADIYCLEHVLEHLVGQTCVCFFVLSSLHALWLMVWLKHLVGGKLVFVLVLGLYLHLHFGLSVVGVVLEFGLCVCVWGWGGGSEALAIPFLPRVLGFSQLEFAAASEISKHAVVLPARCCHLYSQCNACELCRRIARILCSFPTAHHRLLCIPHWTLHWFRRLVYFYPFTTHLLMFLLLLL